MDSANYLGWWIVTGVLALTTIVFVVLWSCSYNPTAAKFDAITPFGVIPSSDGTVLNQCGSGSDPCIYTRASLADAQAQCQILADICQTFSYDPSSRIMKIVNPQSLFTTLNTDAYVRQSLSDTQT